MTITPVAAHPARLVAKRTVATPPSGDLYRGSTTPGRTGVEQSALGLVANLGGIPLGVVPLHDMVSDPGMLGAGVCPASRLRVSWSPPDGRYIHGAYVSPLGPTPDDTTRRVNGVVLCEGSTYSYLGFEASWDGTRWLVNDVPVTSDDDVPRLIAPTDALASTPAVASATPAGADGAGGVAPDGGWGAAIEPLAAYDPQQVCEPSPKPGVVGLRNLLLTSFKGSRDLGIGQPCDTPDGVSEHKEGRAFDWGVDVHNPAEKAMADQLLAWLFAPDRYGNPDAMLRRLGIMYLIWDGHIWGSYRAEEGWRPYVGVSAHTDHIHISFSWAGALGQTSFWSGHVGNVTAVSSSTLFPYGAPVSGASAAATAAAPAPATPPPAPAPAPAATSSGGGSSSSSTSTSTSTTTTTTTAPPPTLPPPTLPPPTIPLGSSSLG
jgi:hypothetical protein